MTGRISAWMSSEQFTVDLHSERLLPLGTVCVVAFLRLLGLAVDCHLHIGAGTKPVLLVFFQFR